MQDSAAQPDRFKPEMPQIPGVNDAAARNRKWHSAKKLSTVLVVTVLGVIGFVGLVIFRGGKGRLQTSAASVAGVPLPAVASDELTADPPKQGPSPVATLSELAEPWSAKNFTFTNPATHADVSAMIVRLPGSASERSASYWAFALNTPYESCDLQYETDLDKLASQYSYHAGHPMVLAACDGTIYDPLRVATSPTGAWVRGEIVHGVGIRPPLAIEIQVQGNSIFANSME